MGQCTPAWGKTKNEFPDARGNNGYTIAAATGNRQQATGNRQRDNARHRLTGFFYILVIVIASMTMVKPAQAFGTVSPSITCSNYQVYNSWTGGLYNIYSTSDRACQDFGTGYTAFIPQANGDVMCNTNATYWAACINPVGACPSNSTPTSASSCTCNTDFKPDPTATTCVPVATCPVSDLSPTDPAMQPYEDGLKDLDNVTEATRAGAACIVRVARARLPRVYSQIISGYRPPAYQTHIREVYDKWQLLKNNNDLACADTKRQVEAEFDHHSPFAHQPGTTSRHSSRTAVDISLSNYAEADAIAAECNMSRPVPNDRPHFESPR